MENTSLQTVPFDLQDWQALPEGARVLAMVGIGRFHSPHAAAALTTLRALHQAVPHIDVWVQGFSQHLYTGPYRVESMVGPMAERLLQRQPTYMSENLDCLYGGVMKLRGHQGIPITERAVHRMIVAHTGQGPSPERLTLDRDDWTVGMGVHWWLPNEGITTTLMANEGHVVQRVPHIMSVLEHHRLSQMVELKHHATETLSPATARPRL